MTRGVLGERIWLARRERPISPHHAKAAKCLAILSGLGLPPLAWGLWAYDIWAVISGIAIISMGKLWFLDRMVWLFQDTCENRKNA